MQSLNRILAALRQEIDAGMTTGVASPSPWSAGKVVVELEVVGREEAGRICFAVAAVAGGGAAAGAGAHADTEAGRSQFKLRLRLDLQRADAADATPTASADGNRDHAPEGARPAPAPAVTETVFQALCGLFGAPGFDSSARACVFREALDGLSDADVAAVITRLAGPREGEGKVAPELERARELLSRVVRSGPAQSFRRGGEILTTLFALAPVAAVLRLVEERWETQREWMNR